MLLVCVSFCKLKFSQRAVSNSLSGLMSELVILHHVLSPSLLILAVDLWSEFVSNAAIIILKTTVLSEHGFYKRTLKSSTDSSSFCFVCPITAKSAFVLNNLCISPWSAVTCSYSPVELGGWGPFWALRGLKSFPRTALAACSTSSPFRW